MLRKTSIRIRIKIKRGHQKTIDELMSNSDTVVSNGKTDKTNPLEQGLQH